nr:hypothetical protein BaRGS_025746 [Batillaria attramentaria]
MGSHVSGVIACWSALLIPFLDYFVTFFLIIATLFNCLFSNFFIFYYGAEILCSLYSRVNDSLLELGQES